MRTEFLCISVLRVASGPRVKLACCKSALNLPVVCSTDHSKAVVPVLVLLFVALWFILRGDLLYVFPCAILLLWFSVFLVLRLSRLGKRELILVLFVRLFGLCLFRFVGFLFLLGSGKGCGLWLWHFLDFSLTFFALIYAWKHGYRYKTSNSWQNVSASYICPSYLDITQKFLFNNNQTVSSNTFISILLFCFILFIYFIFILIFFLKSLIFSIWYQMKCSHTVPKHLHP